MKIGVVSDTHDRLDITEAAIQLLLDRGVELILHCGDIETPDTVRLFKDVPTHFVFGNWDGRTSGLLQAMEEIGATHHPEFGHLHLQGKEIAWVHSHRKGQLRELERSGAFDFLFYGHSHIAETHRTGKTIVANPGALHRARPKTCLVVDVATGMLETVEVAEPAARPSRDRRGLA